MAEETKPEKQSDIDVFCRFFDCLGISVDVDESKPKSKPELEHESFKGIEQLEHGGKHKKNTSFYLDPRNTGVVFGSEMPEEQTSEHRNSGSDEWNLVR
ncbi:MAG: hypothetical protein QM752_06720 [Gammaproteobacteria bacterium]